MSSIPKSCNVACGANLQIIIFVQKGKWGWEYQLIGKKWRVKYGYQQHAIIEPSLCIISPCPDGNKSPPQTQYSALANSLPCTVNKAVVQLGIRRLIHQLGPDHITWCNRDGHEESGNECAREWCFNILPTPSRCLGYVSLRYVIHPHFSRVEYACTYDIDLHSTIEAGNALSLVHTRNEFGKALSLVRIRLCQRLAYVEWVADDWADASGECSGEKFQYEWCIGRVLPCTEEFAYGCIWLVWIYIRRWYK